MLPEIPALNAVHLLMDRLTETGALGATTMFVLNNAFARDLLKRSDIEDALGAPLSADLPYDSIAYLKAVNEGNPVVRSAPKSMAANAMRNLANIVLGPAVGEAVGRRQGARGGGEAREGAARAVRPPPLGAGPWRRAQARARARSGGARRPQAAAWPSANAALTSAVLRYHRIRIGMMAMPRPTPVPANWNMASTASNRLMPAMIRANRRAHGWSDHRPMAAASQMMPTTIASQPQMPTESFGQVAQGAEPVEAEDAQPEEQEREAGERGEEPDDGDQDRGVFHVGRQLPPLTERGLPDRDPMHLGNWSADAVTLSGRVWAVAE